MVDSDGFCLGREERQGVASITRVRPLHQSTFVVSETVPTYASIVATWSEVKSAAIVLLFHIFPTMLSAEYMSGSMEEVVRGGFSRSRSRIGNRWTSVTDLRGRSYAIKITENSTQTSCVPSSWHDLTVCGMFAKKAGLSLPFGIGSTPISEPSVVQSRGAYFAPTKRVRTSSEHASNTASSPNYFYSDRSPKCGSNSLESVSPTIYTGLSASTNALSAEISPSCGRHFLHRHYDDSCRIEELEEGNCAPSVFENASAESGEDEMCLPRPDYFSCRKFKPFHPKRSYKTDTSSRRGLHFRKSQKAKSFGDSLDKRSSFTPMVQRIKSKASEIFHPQRKEDKFGKKSKNTLGETLVSLANVSTEIISLNQSMDGVDKMEMKSSTTSPHGSVFLNRAHLKESSRQIFDGSTRLPDDPNIKYHMGPQSLNKNLGSADKSSDNQEDPSNLPVGINWMCTTEDVRPNLEKQTPEMCLLSSAQGGTVEELVGSNSVHSLFAITKPDYLQAPTSTVLTDTAHLSVVSSQTTPIDQQSHVSAANSAFSGVMRALTADEALCKGGTEQKDTSVEQRSTRTDSSKCSQEEVHSLDYSAVTHNSEAKQGALMTSSPSVHSDNGDNLRSTLTFNHGIETNGVDVIISEPSLRHAAQIIDDFAVELTNPTDYFTVLEQIQFPVLTQPIYGEVPPKEERIVLTFIAAPYQQATETVKLVMSSAQLDVIHRNLAAKEGSSEDALHLNAVDLMESKAVPTYRSNQIDNINNVLETSARDEIDYAFTFQYSTNLAIKETGKQDECSARGSEHCEEKGDARTEQWVSPAKADVSAEAVVSPNVIKPNIVQLPCALPNHLSESDSSISNHCIPSVWEDSSLDDSTTASVITPDNGLRTNAETVRMRTNNSSAVRSIEEKVQSQDDQIVHPKTNQTYATEPTNLEAELRCELSLHPIHTEEVANCRQMADRKNTVRLHAATADLGRYLIECGSPELASLQQEGSIPIAVSYPSTDVQLTSVTPLHTWKTRLLEQCIGADAQLSDYSTETDEIQDRKDGTNEVVINETRKLTTATPPSKSKLLDEQWVRQKDEGDSFLAQQEPCVTVTHSLDLQPDEREVEVDYCHGKSLPGSAGMIGGLTAINANHALPVSFNAEDEVSCPLKSDGHQAESSTVPNARSTDASARCLELTAEGEETTRFTQDEWWNNKVTLTSDLPKDEMDNQTAQAEVLPMINKGLQKATYSQLNPASHFHSDIDSKNVVTLSHPGPETNNAEQKVGAVNEIFKWHNCLAEKASSQRSTNILNQTEAPGDGNSRDVAHIMCNGDAISQPCECMYKEPDEPITSQIVPTVGHFVAERKDKSITECSKFGGKHESVGTPTCADQKVHKQGNAHLSTKGRARETASWNFGAPTSAICFVTLYLPRHVFPLFNTFVNPTDVLTAMADRGLRLAICWSFIHNALRNPFCVAAIFVAFTSASPHLKHWPQLLGSLSEFSDVYLLTPPSRSNRPGLSYWCQWIGDTRFAAPWRGHAIITRFSRHPWSLVNSLD